MAMGGVAYYLSLFENNKSVAQNIQQLCFTRGGELTEEFDRLFSSLFKKANNHLAIVTALKNKGKGMTDKTCWTLQDLLTTEGSARYLKNLSNVISSAVILLSASRRKI